MKLQENMIGGTIYSHNINHHYLTSVLDWRQCPSFFLYGLLSFSFGFAHGQLAYHSMKYTTGLTRR